MTVDEGLSIGLIVGVVVGVIVLLAVIVLVVLCCRKHHQQDKASSSLYLPMSSVSSPPAPAPAGPKMVNLRVIQGAIASGEGTISVSVGDTVQAEPADWADFSSEWLWVMTQKNVQGYVPREFVRMQ